MYVFDPGGLLNPHEEVPFACYLPAVTTTIYSIFATDQVHPVYVGDAAVIFELICNALIGDSEEDNCRFLNAGNAFIICCYCAVWNDYAARIDIQASTAHYFLIASSSGAGNAGIHIRYNCGCLVNSDGNLQKYCGNLTLLNSCLSCLLEFFLIQISSLAVMIHQIISSAFYENCKELLGDSADYSIYELLFMAIMQDDLGPCKDDASLYGCSLWLYGNSCKEVASIYFLIPLRGSNNVQWNDEALDENVAALKTKTMRRKKVMQLFYLTKDLLDPG